MLSGEENARAVTVGDGFDVDYCRDVLKMWMD
jgi:hypothetical protein